MRDPIDLVALRQGLTLLAGEIVLQGWAAKRKDSHEEVGGLVLVTNERLLFTGSDGRDLAFPIFKIDTVEVIAQDEFALVVWYGRLQLRFDTPAAASAVVNILRQDNRWAANTMTALQVRPDMLPEAVLRAA